MVIQPPLCPCHGLVMGWQKDARRPTGGYFECREKRRVYNKTRHEQRVAWLRMDYQRSPKQYVAQRRRHLRQQREAALNELSRLSEEANQLGLVTRRTEPTEAQGDP